MLTYKTTLDINGTSTELYANVGEEGIHSTPVSIDSWTEEGDWTMLFKSRYILSPLDEMLTDALDTALREAGYDVDMAWETAYGIVSAEWGIEPEDEEE